MAAYWVAFALLAAVDRSTKWMTAPMPGMWVIRVAALAWISRGQYRGAEEVYQGFIRPLLARHEPGVDAQLHRVFEHVDHTREKLHAIAAVAAIQVRALAYPGPPRRTWSR